MVDASDPAKDHHIETTEALLAELGLDEIPRILVYNKVDLLEPVEARRLVGRRADVVALSATDRESTRLLLKKIAERLEERWEQARTVPAAALDEEEAPVSEVPFPVFEGAESLTTLDELRGGGRRRDPARAQSSR